MTSLYLLHRLDLQLKKNDGLKLHSYFPKETKSLLYWKLFFVYSFFTFFLHLLSFIAMFLAEEAYSQSRLQTRESG